MAMNRFEMEAVDEEHQKYVQTRAKYLHLTECIDRAKEELRYLSEYLVKKAGDPKNPPDVHQLCSYTDRIKERLNEPYTG